MTTFVTEDTTTRVAVYHQRKVVFFRDVDFWGDVAVKRQAREEAEKLVAYLKEHPDNSAAPLPTGWSWKPL